jgi:hypothetical protein
LENRELICDQNLQIQYAPGKGAWTYYLQIPNTQNIKGKWGFMKVSGFINHLEIFSKNLFSRKGEDKLISINEQTRKALNKSAGDWVSVKLYYHSNVLKVEEQDIIEALADAGVLEKFRLLKLKEKNLCFNKIISQTSPYEQDQELMRLIENLNSD